MPHDNAREPLLGSHQHGSSNHEASSTGGFAYTIEDLSPLTDPTNPTTPRQMGGIDKILKGLKVDPKTGLHSDEAGSHSTGKDSDSKFSARSKAFGRNILPTAKSATFFDLVKRAYNDRTLILLSIAAFVSLGVSIYEDYGPHHNPDEPRVGWIEGAAILAAVAAVVFTNAINDYQKERQFRKLNAKKDDRSVKLLRDGREQEINVKDIQVGDIMLMEPGDLLAVDGVVITSHGITCDESSATGESDAMKKDAEENCYVISGSKVLDGSGKMLVTAVGSNSFFGKTMMAMREATPDETPLQVKLDLLAESIAKLGMAAAIAMLITLVVKYFVQNALSNDDLPPGNVIFSDMVKIVIQAITIVVVAVPEGLPMAVTLALAYATTQMLRDNNLVRVLSACETMGNATTVCSDKTGTLTQNKMTIVEGTLSLLPFTRMEDAKKWKTDVKPEVAQTIIDGIALNSSAFEDKDEKGNLTFIGSKTESALLGFIKFLGASYSNIRGDNNVVKMYPFSSAKKTMSCVVATPNGDEKYRLYVKGASEIVLRACTHYVDAEGHVKTLDDHARAKFEQIISTYADKALRTICLSYRDVSESEFKKFKDDEAPNTKLTCLGVVGIQDPLRPGVVESVASFAEAGVTVRMITGDNLQTAKAIAKNAGILMKGGLAMTGPEFRALSKEEQTQAVKRLQVLARSSPTDKTIVVRRLQELGEVIAVTGDGTNDGPALKMADVGFSMGITGTEVAKEASAIVLMDDNFSSILKALMWGRAVNDSVRKFLQFQLTVNITAVVLSFISAIASEDNQSVLSAVQLLWVNLIMDTLAALALATEPPSPDVLKRQPTDRNAPLINFNMWKMIIGQAIFQIILNLSLLHFGAQLFHLQSTDEDGNVYVSPHNLKVLRTMIFNTFVFLQVFNELNCRRIDDSLNIFKNLHNNKIFILVQAVVVGGQYVIVTFGGQAFKTVPLNGNQWLTTLLIGSLSLPVGLFLRLLPSYLIPESVLSHKSEEHQPLISPSMMRLQGATRSIQNQNRFFDNVRRGNKRKAQHGNSAENLWKKYGSTDNSNDV
ncbi:PMCA-type calcium-translocating P-type ATPase [Linnemannia elongata AG-77]|uniref:Calcium-transporting ATPase n=2 Tax=Linnemannia elongata TaxID=310910 RepID=A0A197KCM3_9FUNG|nr:PMCA-type calcium-translocating P-type ATPase [Linnemannia elongata AG-77]